MVISDVLEMIVYRMYHIKYHIQDGSRTLQSQVGSDFGRGGALTCAISQSTKKTLSQLARLRRDLRCDNQRRTLRYVISIAEGFYHN